MDPKTMQRTEGGAKLKPGAENGLHAHYFFSDGQ